MTTALIVAGSVLAAYLAFLALLWCVKPPGIDARSLPRILPDTLRLCRRLATDPAVPRRLRLALWGLVAYLALPIDLIPDVVPVLGYADDAIVVAVVLRYVVRAAGPARIRERWPGTPEGLAVLARATRLSLDEPGG